MSSLIKLAVISIVVLILSYLASSYMGTELKEVQYEESYQYANKETPYKVNVSNDGQIMRLEFQGTMPMNSWKAFDMEVYDPNGSYLFSYQDELWSESGTDSDGTWVERKQHAYFDINFAKKGEYSIYLTDSFEENPFTANTRYLFRAVPVVGDAKVFDPIIQIFKIIAILCFVVIYILSEFERREKDEKKKKGRRYYLFNKEKANRPYYGLTILCFGFWGILVIIAMSDDDDINYVSYSSRYSQIEVDRSIRQQSLSGANYRAGASRGGK